MYVLYFIGCSFPNLVNHLLVSSTMDYCVSIAPFRSDVLPEAVNGVNCPFGLEFLVVQLFIYTATADPHL